MDPFEYHKWRWILAVSVIVLFASVRCQEAKPPKKLLCVNQECTGVISTATTITNYRNQARFLLPFKANTKLRVFAKPVDPKDEYWGVEIDGFYGFVPFQFLKENSVYVRPKLEVKIEDFMKTVKKLNRETSDKLREIDARKKKIEEQNAKNEEEDEDDFVENEDENEDENESEDEYEVVLGQETDGHTEKLEIDSPTTEPIISSVLPNANIDVEKIEATRSVTIIEGTTIYDTVDNYTAIPENSFERSLPIDNKLNDASSKASILPPIISSQVGETANREFTEDKKMEIEQENSNTGSLEKPTLKENFQESNNASNDNLISNIPSNSPLETQNVESITNIDNLTDVTSDIPIMEASTEVPVVREDFKISEEPVLEMAMENNALKEFSKDTDQHVKDSENIANDPSNVPIVLNNNFQPPEVNDVNISNLESEINVTNPMNAYDVVQNELDNNFKHSEINESNTPNLDTKNNIINPEKFSATVENDNDLPSDTNENNNEIFNESTTENTYFDELNNVSIPDLNIVGETIDNQNVNEPVLNKVDTPISETTENHEHYFTDVPLLHNLIPSTPSINEQHIHNDDVQSDFMYPQEKSFETTTPTIDNTLDTNMDTVIDTEYLAYSSSETPSFDYMSNLDDQHNKLTSDIENEKSFFSSPLILLNDLYSSISNIFKSNSVASTTEKANTNMFNSDEIEPKQFDDVSASKSYFSMYTESSQSTADEKMSNLFYFNSWVGVSAVSVIMFTLGYYYLENRKQDGKLLAMVNSLQKELLCSSKECVILKEELCITKEKLMGIEDSSFGTDEMVTCLKKELADYQQTITDLQEKLASTEEELAHSTEAALELQSILDEQLSAKDTSSSSLAFTITNLQSQLDEQQTTMNVTKAQLATKVEENELLRLKMLDMDNKCAIIEKQLANTEESLKQVNEENENKTIQLQQLAVNLEKSLHQAEVQKNLEVRELQSQMKILTDEMNTVKASLKASNHEVQTLQDSIKMLQLDEKNVGAILDNSHIKAELVKVIAEKNSLHEKYEAELANIDNMNKKVDAQTSKLIEMKEKLNEADHKTLEATTRLEVLTNYFNQKEADLLKELSAKESLWMSQQGEASSTVEKMKALQQEIQQQKEITESVRREVVEQEAASRAKVTTLEQRIHEHWLARRAAERAAEASAREAQTLRQRLAAPSPDKRVVSPLTTGESLPDPAFMPPLGVLPPPPLGFLPPPLGGPMMLPPPLPPLPPHRPPPLGRLSSPPPLPPMRQDRSYSPDSRYSPDRAYSPQQRGRSPFSNSESRRRNYNNRRYDDRYYDSEEDRRSRRYETETDFSPINTLPPSPISNSRNHKGVSSGSGRSYDSLEKLK